MGKGISVSFHVGDKYMKIGIMTFHWAVNYGAVLQVYALQNALEKLGHDVRIINYFPSRYKKNIFNALLTMHINRIPERLREISKDKLIEEFRAANLHRTPYYSSNSKLTKARFGFDCYICGSDQVWNESFFEHGERKKTYSYFLNFAPDEAILASYAASFGVTEYKEALKPDLKRMLSRFDHISVREKTGLKILEDIGIYDAQVVPDPTLLLDPDEYKQFIKAGNGKKKYAYVYMLHGRASDAAELIAEKKAEMDIVYCKNGSVEEWLSDIYYSDEVITNSFHGLVFSILFKKDFTAVLVKGSGMNDRIVTLLTELGLENRIYNGSCKNSKINWEDVNKRLLLYQKTGYDFLNSLSKKAVK